MLGRQVLAVRQFLCYRIVVLGGILPNAFPGWASGAATSLTFLAGLSENTVPWNEIGG
jgi:hypothetical protein